MLKQLKRAIRKLQDKPLSNDYQKALVDVLNEIEKFENNIHDQNKGTICLQISCIGNVNYSCFSGDFLDAFQYILDFLNMNIKNNKCDKFLIEVKSKDLELRG